MTENNNAGFSVVGFTKQYKALTKKAFNISDKLYYFFLINLIALKLGKGVVVCKINKPTTRGTTVKFKVARGKSDLERASDMLTSIIDKITELDKISPDVVLEFNDYMRAITDKCESEREKKARDI